MRDLSRLGARACSMFGLNVAVVAKQASSVVSSLASLGSVEAIFQDRPLTHNSTR